MKRADNGKSKRYYSGDEGCEGIYSERKLYRLYKATVNKNIYPTYRGWKWDMLRSGTIANLNKGERNET